MICGMTPRSAHIAQAVSPARGTTTTGTTGTSTTLSEQFANCGTFAVFCTLNHKASVVAHNGHATLSKQEYDELQLWDLDCLLTDCTRGICWTCTTEASTPCQLTATGESLWFSEQSGPQRSPSRHDRDVDDLDIRGLCTCRCTTTGMSNPVQEQYLKNLDGHLAQFAPWAHVAGAQLESPPLCRRTGTGARHRRGTAGTCRCMVTGTYKPRNAARSPAPSPLHNPGTHFGAPGRRLRLM